VDTVSMGREISAFEMMQTIGRAGVASRTGNAAQITAYIRSLSPEELVEEFHRSVVILSERNLLSQRERAEIADYARDWVHSQPLSL
jgi:hypothetical protein